MIIKQVRELTDKDLNNLYIVINNKKVKPQVCNLYNNTLEVVYFSDKLTTKFYTSNDIVHVKV